MTDARSIAEQRVAESDAKEADAERLRVREAAEEWLTMWIRQGSAELPPGEQGNSTECVLAHALGGGFGGDNWSLPSDRLAHKLGFENVKLPEDVSDFIRRFDAGEYPDLIQGGDDV